MQKLDAQIGLYTPPRRFQHLRHKLLSCCPVVKLLPSGGENLSQNLKIHKKIRKSTEHDRNLFGEESHKTHIMC